MTASENAAPIHLGIVLGDVAHPKTVMEDLWMQATKCLDGSGRRLIAFAVYVDNGANGVTTDVGDLAPIAVKVVSGDLLATLAAKFGRYRGAVGVGGRLLTENLHSRRVARAIARHPELRQRLCAADVIVAADPAADRTVWQFRKKTSAMLMHGPFAMATAIRRRVGELNSFP